MQWAMPPSGRGPIRWASHPTKCIDVSQGGTANGNNIWLWDCVNGGQHQNMQWTLPPSGVGAIRWSAHPSKCIDVAGGNSGNGNNIQLWECVDSGNHLNMQWIIPKGTSAVPGSPGRVYVTTTTTSPLACTPHSWQLLPMTPSQTFRFEVKIDCRSYFPFQYDCSNNPVAKKYCTWTPGGGITGQGTCQNKVAWTLLDKVCHYSCKSSFSSQCVHPMFAFATSPSMQKMCRQKKTWLTISQRSTPTNRQGDCVFRKGRIVCARQSQCEGGVQGSYCYPVQYRGYRFDCGMCQQSLKAKCCGECAKLKASPLPGLHVSGDEIQCLGCTQVSPDANTIACQWANGSATGSYLRCQTRDRCQTGVLAKSTQAFFTSCKVVPCKSTCGSDAQLFARCCARCLENACQVAPPFLDMPQYCEGCDVLPGMQNAPPAPTRPPPKFYYPGGRHSRLLSAPAPAPRSIPPVSLNVSLQMTLV